ncbi:MAG: tetratricopeptide repeat protein [Pseudomonadota bacterium]
MRYLTDNVLKPAALLAVVLGLAACAGGPTASAPTTPRTAEVAEAATEVAPAVMRQYTDAQTLMSVEDYAGAAQILEPFVGQYPQFPAAATTLAIALRELGREDEALARLETMLVSHDGYAPGWNEVGILHRQAGRFADAEAAYLKAVTVKPDYALAHFNYGILLDLYLARPKQALEHYERYQSLAPDEDKDVKRWIADISRRIARATQAAQVAQ